MPRDPKALGTSRDWLARARSNLTRATQPKPDGVYWEDLCFDAQQAVEKGLKAFLIARKIPFRFVHDVGELLNLLLGDGVEVPDDVLETAELTEYAVEARYPGTYEPVTEEEYNRAAELAQIAVAWVASQIEDENAEARGD